MEENNNKYLKTKLTILFVIACVLVGTLLGASYAFFNDSVQGNNTAGNNVVKTVNDLSIEIENGETVNNTNMVPGDTITKKFTISNPSNVSLTYSVLLTNVINELVDKSDFVYTLTSSDGGYNVTSDTVFPKKETAIVDKHTIASKASHTYTLTVKFLNKETEQNSSMEKEVSGTIQLNDGSWEPAPVSFATSSWSDIIEAYNEGDTEQLEADMENGTTRNIELTGGFGTHPVRIANLTPCSTANVVSQSACGLVIEFADIISEHRMNPYSNSGNSNGDGNKGGWEYSDMRSYVNSTTYTAGNINYSSTGIYSNMPSDLKPLIISTSVVSGHGSRDSANFTTDDYMYLLSTIEVWNGNNSYDSASGTGITRQLDYYNTKGVTTSSYSAAIKQNSGSNANWWLRSTRSYRYYNFNNVTNNGNYDDYSSSDANGVSPAFRLAN